MLNSQNEINDILGEIPAKFLPTILEYAKMINEKAKNGELSDTEYINSIPGIADSIVREANRDLDEYSDKLDW